MTPAIFERMSILGKAARAFSGMLVEPRLRRGDNTGTAMLFELYLQEQIQRVQQPPKMQETFAGQKAKST
jgi:hypothetical protein